MTIVEKMALAVREADAKATLRRLPDINPSVLELALDAMKSSHEAMALAALKAIREPSEGMRAAVVAELSDATVQDPKAAAWDWLRAHRAAIDHAIQEHKQ